MVEITLKRMQFVPRKLYYKIREVGDIVGVEAHVLRFWETVFPMLSPPKSKSGQRIYRPKDIELLLRIRTLLYEEGYTIPGARKQLSAGVDDSPGREVPKRPAAKKDPGAAAAVENDAVDTMPSEKNRLKRVQAELENILTLLDRE